MGTSIKEVDLVGRFFAAAVLAGGIIWLGIFITQYISDKEELAEKRQTNALYEATFEVYQRQAELAESILEFREGQRLVQDTARQKAIRGIYEAREETGKSTEEFDRPLPHAIVGPLRLQYEAISAGSQGGHHNATKESFAGTPGAASAGIVNAQNPGPLDQ